VVPFYEDLLGVPFLWYGRDPAVGLSCIGLPIEIYRRAGLHVLDPSVPGVDREAVEAQWKVIEMPPFREMDVMNLGRPGREVASHYGIFLEDGRLLHSEENRGVVVDHFENIDLWIDCAYRWRNAQN
jgi:cell wall-associated NlpC family hydrolase